MFFTSSAPCQVNGMQIFNYVFLLVDLDSITTTLDVSASLLGRVPFPLSKMETLFQVNFELIEIFAFCSKNEVVDLD